MKIELLDTCSLIYLSKANTIDPKDSEDRIRGRKLLNYLGQVDANSGIAAVPTIGLTEYLSYSGFTPEQVTASFEDILSAYAVLEFNARASLEAARIYRKHGKSNLVETVGKFNLKSDIYICGIAVAYNANSIVTNDTHFETLLVGTSVRVVLIDSLPTSLLDTLDPTE